MTAQTLYFHDYAPTHSETPAYVLAAAAARRLAWNKRDEIGLEYIEGHAGLDSFNEAHAAALAADEYYADTYAAWQRGEVAGCTCSPVGDTCPDCRARAAAGHKVFEF